MSQKRCSTAKALKEFLDLYEVDEYYFVDKTSPNYRDDSVEIFYTKKLDGTRK